MSRSRFLSRLMEAHRGAILSLNRWDMTQLHEMLHGPARVDLEAQRGRRRLERHARKLADWIARVSASFTDADRRSNF